MPVYVMLQATAVSYPLTYSLIVFVSAPRCFGRITSRVPSVTILRGRKGVFGSLLLQNQF